MQDQNMGGTAPPDPTPVVERIREMVDYGGSWSFEAGEIRDLLGLSSEAFYRRIYEAERRDHPLVSLDSAMGSYSQENIWEFVALIELFCGAETEPRLERAGVFFTHPEQMEILGVFLAEAAAALRGHRVQTEQFSSMLRTFGSFEQARRVYIGEFVPFAGLIARAVEFYCAGRTFAIPELARSNVKRLLEFFVQKHVLEPGSVYGALSEKLLRQAAAEGYAPEEEGIGEEQADSGIPDRSPRLEKARRAMNLADRPLTQPLLKARYKRLMKIYHPDINPRGLRRCQEITAAYSLLLSTL
jgi:hypothetical protein